MASTDVKKVELDINRSLYDDADDHTPKFTAKPGINEEVVRLISQTKNEPAWMLQKRLKALEHFNVTKIPGWGPDLSKLDLNEIIYFIDPNAKESTSWEDVPDEIKQTFEKLGIPKAEREALAGTGAQYDSGMIYHNIKKSLADKGVIFENMDVALQKYPELVKKYFMTSCIPITDHKFIMLHAACWSGGTFIYVPKGVKVDLPLQAYFRMNAQQGGQFEHTLIIVDEGAELHYIEGCSSPRYQANSLHAGCVEIFVMKNAVMRYTSIENWSRNVYNLNTKRAIVHENAKMYWVNGNTGCLTGDTDIFVVKDGLKKMEEIKPGDQIYAWNKDKNSIEKSKVLSKKCSGIKKTYELKAGGRTIKASDNHPFLSLTRRKKSREHKKGFFQFEWKYLRDLKKGDVVGIAKRLPFEGKSFPLPKYDYKTRVTSKNQHSGFTMDIGHLYNKKITLPNETNKDLMWFLGILLGDGFVDKKSNKTYVALHITDDLRETFMAVVKKLFNYQISSRNDRYIEIYSKVLCDLVERVGFAGDAKTKKIPKWVFQLPKEQIEAFLAGYFDADGHPTSNALAFTSINRNVLKSVKLLGIQCGYYVSQIFRHGYARKQKIIDHECNVRDSWRLHLNGKKVKTFPTRSKRKFTKVRDMKSKRAYNGSEGLNFSSRCNQDIGFARIDSIEYIGEKETFDIEVGGNHNFIANGLIVHNSSRTMLYPSSILVGEGAHSESLGIAFAGKGQDQDTGTKMIHVASDTSSLIRAKSISKNGGISSYRGLVRVNRNAVNCISRVECDALLLDKDSVSKTYPFMKVDNNTAKVSHEASVGKIGEEQLFYLMSRGLSEDDAIKMVVAGFISPIVRALPLEYAVELNKLIELEVEGL